MLQKNEDEVQKVGCIDASWSNQLIIFEHVPLQKICNARFQTKAVKKDKKTFLAECLLRLSNFHKCR